MAEARNLRNMTIAQTPLLGVRHRCVVCEGQRAVVTVVVGR